MNEIKIFESAYFGSVRTVQDNGQTLFSGSDVAKALGYARPNDAVSQHCRSTVKHSTPHPQSPSRFINMTYITEGDVFRLITHSKLPAADKFERWVFDEILPTIRKHGAYMTDDTLARSITDPDFLIGLATELKEEQQRRRALEVKVQEDKPKVIFADAVSVAKTSILIGELAKLINQNGVDIGQKRLFEWMRNKGYLIKRLGADYNTPTQRAMEMWLFEIKETTISHADGHTTINKTPKVTGKGQMYFINKFLN